MSEPRTQHGALAGLQTILRSGAQPGAQPDAPLDTQPDDVSDEQLDALLKDALNARHMPPGLAEKTMARIRAQAAIEARADTETEAEAETGAFVDFGTRADTASPATDQASNPQAAAPQAAAPQLSVVQPPAAEKRPRANASSARRSMPRRRFVQLMAACIAASALAVGGGALAFADETAQVEIDGSAIAELGLNRWDRVVRVWANDDDLASALSALGLVGMSCEDALAAIAVDDAVAGLLAHDRIELVACSNDASQMQSVLDTCSAAADGFGPGTACSTADSQTRAEARAAGMGVARYQVYCQIAAIDPTYTTETCASMSMRELRVLLAGLTGKTQEGTGHGNGRGQSAGQGASAGMGAGRGQGYGSGRGSGMGRGAEGEHEG